MNKTSSAFNVLTMCILLLAGSSLARAQATRTWVSAAGSDANPCSRTAPCQTFAGAFSKTAVNGEINVIDPGAFGTLTISKSISINGDGNFAGVLASGTTGFLINLTTTLALDPVSSVRLRNVDINGTGSCGAGCGTRTGIRGINVSSANTRPVKVVVEDSVIDGFVNEGILVASNGGDLVVTNTVVRNNGTAGIKLDSSGANLVRASIEHTKMVFNLDGMRVEDVARASIKDSLLTNNTNGLNVTNVTGSNVVNIVHSLISENTGTGIISAGPVTFSTVNVADCMISDNGTGVVPSGNGRIFSWVNNFLSGNSADGTFTLPNNTLK
jgi:hypothetical protein